MAIFVVAIGFIFWLVIAGLAGALVAIPPAAASGCDNQPSEGSVYAVYITCAPEPEPALFLVPGLCTVPPPGRCDSLGATEPGLEWEFQEESRARR